MKRVVLIRSNPVNPDPPVEKMANALLRLNYSVHILAWDRNHDNQDDVINTYHLTNGDVGITTFGIKASYGGGLKKTLPALAKFQYRIMKWLLINRNEYDIIHAFDFDTGCIASICAGMLKKQVVYHILDYYVAAHNLTGSVLGRCIECAEISVINHADATIICTDKRKEQICKATPRRLFVVHNTPIDCEIVASSIVKQGTGEKAAIVFVGTFGSERFLQEVLQIVKDRSDVELHIGGYGELEDLVESEAASNDNVYYYGRLSYEKTLSLESQCDVMFAMYTPEVPNHRYAAPNKFYEALMLGKPIIMANNTGFDDIIKKNSIGEMADYSKNGFNVALDMLLSRRDNWPEMKRRSRELYDMEYSWSIMEARIAELYSAIEL